MIYSDMKYNNINIYNNCNAKIYNEVFELRRNIFQLRNFEYLKKSEEVNVSEEYFLRLFEDFG